MNISRKGFLTAMTASAVPLASIPKGDIVKEALSTREKRLVVSYMGEGADSSPMFIVDGERVITHDIFWAKDAEDKREGYLALSKAELLGQNSYKQKDGLEITIVSEKTPDWFIEQTRKAVGRPCLVCDKEVEEDIGVTPLCNQTCATTWFNEQWKTK